MSIFTLQQGVGLQHRPVSHDIKKNNMLSYLWMLSLKYAQTKFFMKTFRSTAWACSSFGLHTVEISLCRLVGAASAPAAFRLFHSSESVLILFGLIPSSLRLALIYKQIYEWLWSEKIWCIMQVEHYSRSIHGAILPPCMINTMHCSYAALWIT